MDFRASAGDQHVQEFHGILETEALKRRIQNHRENIESGNNLWDFREADLSKISHAEILALARELSENRPPTPPCRNALVFSTPFGFGLGRSFEMGADWGAGKCEVRCFYRLEDATIWLGWSEPEKAWRELR